MWIAVSTQPNREMLAIDNLRRQGYETYCPVIQKRVSHARKIQLKNKPLFPGYIFVLLDEVTQGCRTISSTFGVRNMVSFGGTPARLPTSFIEGLKAQEVDGVMPAPAIEDVMPVGATVLIKDGIFKDLIATVLSCRAQERVIVMLDFLKRSVKAEVPADYLERA